MSVAEIFCKISDKLFGYYSDKVKIIANVLMHDWRMLPPTRRVFPAIGAVAEKEIAEVFSSLDEQSRFNVLRYVKSQIIMPRNSEDERSFIYNFNKWFTKEELRQRRQKYNELLALRRTFRLPDAGVESLVSHHGLRSLSQKVLQHLRDTVFIDAGACHGDSSIVFALNYHPQKILAIEPSELNRKQFEKTMAQNNISESWELIPLGVGRNDCELYMNDTGNGCNTLNENINSDADTHVAITTVDNICSDIRHIGLIKADLEGMGLEMLLGAEKTIKQNRPLLTLSIYHNRDELFGIYQTLQRWNLNYTFKIDLLASPLVISELTLIGYPAEWEKRIRP